MTDEKKKEEAPQEQIEGQSKETSTSLIEKAEAAADRIEAANAKQEEIVSRQEYLQAQKILGGKSDAGSAPEKPKRLTDAEYFEASERGEVDPFNDNGK